MNYMAKNAPIGVSEPSEPDNIEERYDDGQPDADLVRCDGSSGGGSEGGAEEPPARQLSVIRQGSDTAPVVIIDGLADALALAEHTTDNDLTIVSTDRLVGATPDLDDLTVARGCKSFIVSAPHRSSRALWDAVAGLSSSLGFVGAQSVHFIESTRSVAEIAAVAKAGTWSALEKPAAEKMKGRAPAEHNPRANGRRLSGEWESLPAEGVTVTCTTDEDGNRHKTVELSWAAWVKRSTRKNGVSYLDVEVSAPTDPAGFKVHKETIADVPRVLSRR